VARVREARPEGPRHDWGQRPREPTVAAVRLQPSARIQARLPPERAALLHLPRGGPLSTFARLADIAVEIDGYELEGQEFEASPTFTRLSTTIRLRGAGEEGIGEDVTYDALDHVALQDAGPIQPLAGSHTVGAFCDLAGGLDLFAAGPPVREWSRLYRRWAFESAALDLALRQAGIPLTEALGLEARPVTFVASLRLGEPPTIDPVARRLERYPGLRFKLDPTSSWTDDLVAELVETGAVDSVDFKGQYKGTVVDQPPDPELYTKVVESFPDAWLEDPALTDETDPILAPHRDRITWDAPIHSIADIEALPFPPKMVNVKPSRVGGLRPLLDTYDWCAARGITAYGGGQWELGCGRGQIQYLASLFHPDAPNDVAPSGYNDPRVPPGLPESPLRPAPAETGFRWNA
jgi:L-alanine-DL-glutamate epimerase-like enolase superfamily enzyme